MTADMDQHLTGRDGPVAREPDFATVSTELMSVITALWHDIDRNGGEAAAMFFSPDATLRFSNAEFQGRTQIEEVYANRMARGPRVSRHVVTNLHLLEVEPRRVHAISVLLLFGEDGEAPRPTTSPAMVGDVLDEFEFAEGRWLIKSRWIRNLFIGPATELAVPQE
ncbi:nuclear transport factor 2 family protein [Streptomyces sp. NPDC013178]|uniref:nuclear transport factor 2 family protein n=1 Tax=Streptomyces sp. NPDC013178 TaxID=3155118 RepID=UPI00340371B1